MLGAGRISTLFSDVRRIADGPGAGLKIVPLEGDREIALGRYEVPVQAAPSQPQQQPQQQPRQSPPLRWHASSAACSRRHREKWG